MTTMQDSDLAYGLAGYGRKNNRFDARRRFAMQQLQAGSDTSPVQSPWQGASRLASALAGGLDMYMTDRDEKAANTARDSKLASAMAKMKTDPDGGLADMFAVEPEIAARGATQMAVERAKLGNQQAMLKTGAANFGQAYGQGGQPQGQPTPLQGGNPREAIAGIESRGQPNGGYGAVGPVANDKGNRAYGRYQIMDFNVGPWTQQILGKAMTPQEFLADQKAQDAVFDAKYSEYVQKYGSPQAAARAWFAGEGGMNNPNAKDVNGVSVAQYEQKFNNGMGGRPTVGPGAIAQAPLPPLQGQPPQLAQGDGAPPQPNASGISSPTLAPPGVPDVPRPQPSPQQIQQYQQRIASGEFGMGPDAVSKARAAMDAEIDRQWQVDRDRAKMLFEQKQGDYASARKQQSELDKAAPMALIQQRTKNYEETIRPKAEAAVSEINAIHQTRQLLDAGAITGTGAEARVAMQKFAQTLGIDWGTDQVANTAALQSAVGQRVLALVKNLGAGTGISNADREYAAKIAGGEISMTEQSMRRIMDIGERAARATLKNHDGEVSRLRKLNGMANIPSDYFDIPAAPTYEQWKAANAQPGAPPPAAAPGAPGPVAAQPGVQPNGFAPHPNPNAPTNMADPLEGKTATNPQTGQKIMRRGGQWVPVQ